MLIVMLVDVGEIEIERPKKTKTLLFWQAEMHCALKAQLLVEFKTGQIICTAVDKGKTQDFKLRALQSFAVCLVAVVFSVPVALPGFAKHHTGACTPTKKPRKQALVKEEKQHNRALARLRVRVELGNSSFQDMSAFFQDAIAIEEAEL